MTVQRKKHKMHQHEWLALWAAARTDVPDSRLDELVARTVERVKRVVTRCGGRAAYAWSGGKDSLALEVALRGVVDVGMIGLTTDLEYPDFEAWLRQHAPPGLTVVRTPQTWAWLRAHPGHLYPHQSEAAKLWYAKVHWAAQEDYCRDKNIRVLCQGRRNQEGNRCGSAADDYTTSKQGVVTLNPLADWNHSEVMALVQRTGLTMPPYYSHPKGWENATHPWAAKQVRADEHVERVRLGWDYTDSVDPAIRVRARAEGIVGA